MIPKKLLNWKPDPPDFRDHKYATNEMLALVAALPTSTDLRHRFPPIVDQANIGSCTGNALAGALGFLEWAQVGSQAFQPFSRLFIYYNERALEGDTRRDDGATLRDGIKTLAAQGVCFESLWPYKKSNVFRKPPAKDYTQASPHRIVTYQSLNNTHITQLKDCLAKGFPFVFGFSVYDSFMSAQVASMGRVPMPNVEENYQGGHAVVGVGYNDAAQYFIVRNSWGTGWGDQGYFYMPYAYVTDPDLADSFWTIKT